LIAASILMPGGFLLGGIVIYGADPGLGIFLLPVGGIMLFVSVMLTALATRSFGKSSSS
jgi:high-affinity Fe2+/Pb2+ permease